eukprot:3939889-Rhodomonas_salina.1
MEAMEREKQEIAEAKHRGDEVFKGKTVAWSAIAARETHDASDQLLQWSIEQSEEEAQAMKEKALELQEDRFRRGYLEQKCEAEDVSRFGFERNIVPAHHDKAQEHEDLLAEEEQQRMEDAREALILSQEATKTEGDLRRRNEQQRAQEELEELSAIEKGHAQSRESQLALAAEVRMDIAAFQESEKLDVRVRLEE